MKLANELIWDKITRALHWSIAVIIFLNLFILEEGDPPHRYIGYLAAGFVFIRFIYGLTTQGFSSFKYFPLSFSELKKFISAKFKKQDLHYPAHNPAAAWTYLGIWFCILALAVTGYMLGLDAYFGDETIEEIHEAFSFALEFLIVFHFVGIILDSIQFKRKTWLAMITGKK